MGVQPFWPIKTAISIKKLTGVTSSISPLLSAAGIKSLVKIWGPQPPHGDGAVPSRHSAPPALSQLHGEIASGMLEGCHLFCVPAVGKEDMPATPSCVCTEMRVLEIQRDPGCRKPTPKVLPYRCCMQTCPKVWPVCMVCPTGCFDKTWSNCKNWEISHKNWNLQLLLKSRCIRPHWPLFVLGSPMMEPLWMD